jgi:hypothetical protein
LQPDPRQIGIEVFKNIPRDSRALTRHPTQEVLRIDAVVMGSQCFLVGQVHVLPCPAGEALVRRFSRR